MGDSTPARRVASPSAGNASPSSSEKKSAASAVGADDTDSVEGSVPVEDTNYVRPPASSVPLGDGSFLGTGGSSGSSAPTEAHDENTLIAQGLRSLPVSQLGAEQLEVAIQKIDVRQLDALMKGLATASTHDGAGKASVGASDVQAAMCSSSHGPSSNGVAQADLAGGPAAAGGAVRDVRSSPFWRPRRPQELEQAERSSNLADGMQQHKNPFWKALPPPGPLSTWSSATGSPVGGSLGYSSLAALPADTVTFDLAVAFDLPDDELNNPEHMMPEDLVNVFMPKDTGCSPLEPLRFDTPPPRSPNASGLLRVPDMVGAAASSDPTVEEQQLLAPGKRQQNVDGVDEEAETPSDETSVGAIRELELFLDDVDEGILSVAVEPSQRGRETVRSSTARSSSVRSDRPPVPRGGVFFPAPPSCPSPRVYHEGHLALLKRRGLVDVTGPPPQPRNRSSGGPAAAAA